MPSRPSVIVYDVNETLSDLSPMADRFVDVGAPAALAPRWFASVLRDAFALTVVGSRERFAVIAREVMRGALTALPLDGDVDAAVEHVMRGFLELPVHPDVVDGVRALHADGHRQVTLSNGAASVAEALLARAGVRDVFEAVLSVEDAGAWKPARPAYEHAARHCGVEPADMLMVAVHPWDLDGAARAGLSTVWIDRAGVPYPAFFTPPTVTVRALTELPAALAR